MRFTEFLVNKRKTLKLSLRKASELIGISHGYLNKLELGFDERSGKANKPTPEVLKMIASAYKVDYEYLMILCNYINKNAKTVLSQDELQLLDYYNKLDEIDQAYLLARAEAMVNNKEVYKDVDKQRLTLKNR